MMRPTLHHLSLSEIYKAHKRIKQYIRNTPLDYSFQLSKELRTSIYLKLENLQVTGSFKPRGSLNKLLNQKPQRGVIASTAGNHGIGVSYAAYKLGIKADIYLPTWADKNKIAKLEQYGANLRFFETVELAREAAHKLAKEQDLMFISAYNDVDMITGGGTIGLEIFDECPDVDLVVVGVGGGGFASGICCALKQLNPHIQIIGVQAEKSAMMTHWLKHQKVVNVPLETTIAEGLAVNMEHDTITFPILRKHLDQMILVSEDEIKDALKWALTEHQMVFEPSGAATIAGLRKLSLESFKNVVGIITGQNISMSRLLNILGLSEKIG